MQGWFGSTRRRGSEMTQDEVIAMAKEAGMDVAEIGVVEYLSLKHFAALVSAKEREACAQVAEAMAPEFGEKGWAARERGDFTLSLGMLGVEFQLKECATNIRARGNPS